MDVKQLRYFSAVYERRNLSHAAQECFVAQSALSHHLSNLEAELGVKLFERLARGMAPTPAGTRLYEHAQAILRSIDAAGADVRQLSAEITGQMQLGLAHTVIDAIAVPLIQRLRDELPKAEVMLHESFSSELHEQVLNGRIDLAFGYNSPPDERIKLTRVHDEPLCCVGHAEMVGPNSDPILFEDAMKLPQIVLHRGPTARSISNQARVLQAMHSSAVFEFNSMNCMRKATAAGLAVVICPYITMRDLAQRGEVIARPIIDPVPTRSFNIERLTDRLPTRLMEAVQLIVLQIIQEETQSGRWPTVRPS